MLSYRILRHAILMVANNLGDVFRLSAPMMGIAVAVPLIVLVMGGTSDPMAQGGPGFNLPLVFLAALVQFAVTMWVLVAWHRYALLEEQPGTFASSVPPGRVVDYIGRVFLIALVCIAAAMAVGAIVLLAVAVFGDSGLGVALSSLLAFTGFLMMYPFVLRLSVSLPAAAIGEPLGLRGAWEATQGQSLLCLGILLWGIIAGLLASLPLILAAFLLPAALFAIAEAVFNVLYAVVAASVLTTLYGYFVEKRELM